MKLKKFDDYLRKRISLEEIARIEEIAINRWEELFKKEANKEKLEEIKRYKDLFHNK